jgi:hypothetical protein
MTIIYEVHWSNPVDELTEKYKSIKNKKSKEAKDLKNQIIALIEEEEERLGRKLYIRP